MRFGHKVWVRVIVIIPWPYFKLISSCHSWRWVAAVSWLCCLILAVDLWGSSAQSLAKHAVDPMLGSSTVLYIHHAVSNDFKCLTWGCFFFLSLVSPILFFFLLLCPLPFFLFFFFLYINTYTRINKWIRCILTREMALGNSVYKCIFSRKLLVMW